MSTLLYPPYLQWEVVSECNHKCIHCYNYWRAYNIPVESSADFEKITDKIIERKPVYLAITGGEPFLVFDKIKPCILRMKKAGINLSISTNGTLIKREHLPFIRDNNIDLVISLPSIDDNVCNTVCNSTGVVSKLKKLFPLLTEYEIPTTINIVISKLNLPTLYMTLKALSSFNFTLRVGIAQRPINASEEYLQYELCRDDFKEIMRQCVKAKRDYNVNLDFSVCLPDCAYTTEEEFLELDKGSCFAGTTHYALCPNGDVKACQCDFQTYGNILTDSFDKIYEKMSKWRDGSLIPDECVSCNKLYSCRGGCRVEAYANTGNYKSLPTFADLSNVPVKFEKKVTRLDFTSNSRFVLSHEVSFLEDVDCSRMTSGIIAVHISKDFATWLQSHLNFTYSELKESAEVSEEELTAVLQMLINNNMIQQVL